MNDFAFRARGVVLLVSLGLLGMEGLHAEVVAVRPVPPRVLGMHRLDGSVQQRSAEQVSANDRQRKPWPFFRPKVIRSRVPQVKPGTAALQRGVAVLLMVFWKSIEHVKGVSALQELVTNAGDSILAERDVKAAEVLGWRFLAEDMPKEAEIWFLHAVRWLPSATEAQYGLALALQGQDRQEEAYELSSALPQAPAHKLALDLRAQLGKREYDQARYSAAIDWLDHPEVEVEQRGLLAWARFKAGRIDEASRDFEDLYHRSPSAATAQGWATALAAGHDGRTLRMWGAGDDPLLREAASAYLADQYRGRGLFLAAAVLDTSRDRARADSLTAVALGAGVRQRAGVAGLDRLTTSETPLLVLEKSNAHRGWGLQVAALDLDSGRAAANAPLGSARGFAHQVTGRAQGMLDWRVSFRNEGWRSLRLSLGSTPLGGELSPRFVGELQGQFQLEDGQWRLGLFARPQRDSLLSYTGLHDPSSGRRWGRVVASGIEASVDHKVDFGSDSDANAWWLHAEGRVMQLNGSGVADNNALEASAGIQRNWQLDDLGRIANGPRLVWRHFSSNHNHFTLGYGGYFSPQSYVGVGDAFQFRSIEGRRWLVQVEAEAFVASQRASAGACFMESMVFSDSVCRNYEDSAQTGLSGRLQMAIAWLIAPTQVLALTMESRSSLNYRDTAVMLTWKLNPQARSGLTAADLNSTLAQSQW